MDIVNKKLRVFVSYGHDEYLPFARQVARELRSRSHEVWFDEERLRPGVDWEQYIEDGLDWVATDKANGRILLIMTPYSVRRPDGYCLNEIAKALDNRLSIIPVMLVWATPPLSIYRLQYLDLQHSQNKCAVTETFGEDFDRIYNVLEKPEILDQDGVTSALKHVLEPLDFEADLTYYQSWFTGREWVFDRIKQWLETTDASKLFWLVGIPGIGKTALSTVLFQRLPNVAAIHLCRRGHSEKSSPKRAVCSIAYQLATQLPEYRDRLAMLDIKREVDRCNEKALFDVLLLQPLSHVSSPDGGPRVILIDALDEATHDGRNAIAQFVGLEFGKLPSWLRFIITSRPEEECIANLQQFTPWQLDPQRSENYDDLNLYVRKRLVGTLSVDELDVVARTLIKRSEGSFLYVTCLCNDICSGKITDLNDPSTYPDGMSGFYYSYFDNQFGKQLYRSHIRPAFEVLMAAGEPLSEETMQTFLGWNDDMLFDFRQIVGSFILRSNRGLLMPFHASLFDWLENREKARAFQTDKREGAKPIYAFIGKIWRERLMQYDSIEDYKALRDEVEKQYGLVIEKLYALYMNALSLGGQFDDLMRFMTWYMVLPVNSTTIYDCIARIESDYFEDLHRFPEIRKYEDTMLARVSDLHSEIVNRLKVGQRGVSSYVYFISLLLKSYLNPELSASVLERHCQIVRSAIPFQKITIYKFGIMRDEHLSGIYADEIRNLFFDLVASKKVQSSEIISWLESIAMPR